MPDDLRRSIARTRGVEPTPASSVLSPSVLQEALTPRGLFTNLFPVSFGSTSLGTLHKTAKAAKEDFDDRRRPHFYQSGNVLYAYGQGLDEFKDTRFTPAIVAIEQEPFFALHLARFGLADFLRGKGYLVRSPRSGISVIDHEETIAAAASDGSLLICPEYTFQPQRLEGADGTPIYAFSVEAAWATVPAFQIGAHLAAHAKRLEGFKLVLECQECGPHCPLFDRLNRVVGTFVSFDNEGGASTSKCRCEDYKPLLIRVRQLVRQPRSKGPSGNRGRSLERTVVLPGQVVRLAASQRRVLQLFHDGARLEREARVWLGDLTASGKVRSGALRVRYERIQRFLARLAGHETRGVAFTLATGANVTLERMPIQAEELADD